MLANVRETKDVIHRLTNLLCFVDIHEEISQFILQISLRPLKFSGLGLFYFGYDFLRKFFVTLLTAVLFMVQTNGLPIFQILDNYNITLYNKK
ncbi:hypothetical protein PUN28_010895 [Cardiocondyla obscurior]|uniref:Uncharacterized protein n=1 Tax=Cardiocondyla obscurior TaxID=286306 RepID=A0AAW2FLL5_9HYME